MWGCQEHSSFLPYALYCLLFDIRNQDRLYFVSFPPPAGLEVGYQRFLGLFFVYIFLLFVGFKHQERLFFVHRPYSSILLFNTNQMIPNLSESSDLLQSYRLFSKIWRSGHTVHCLGHCSAVSLNVSMEMVQQ